MNKLMSFSGTADIFQVVVLVMVLGAEVGLHGCGVWYQMHMYHAKTCCRLTGRGRQLGTGREDLFREKTVVGPDV